jgi:putative NADH-flavin reductase
MALIAAPLLGAETKAPFWTVSLDAQFAGHQVNARARSTADAALILSGARILEGDARDDDVIAKALFGCDGVISALGAKLSLFHEETGWSCCRTDDG